MTCVGIRTRRLKDRHAIASSSFIRIFASSVEEEDLICPSRLRLERRCLLTVVVDRTPVLIVVRARQVRNQDRGRGRGRATSVAGSRVERWVDHANRCHCSSCAIATVTIMIITWSTRERGTNDDEITREWMCLLRFNECGVGNYL